MFEKMVAACGDKLRIMLNTDYREVVDSMEFGRMIYTGPIDEFFDNCHGQLPYRSLRFENESFIPEQLVEREAVSGKPGHWQPAMQVNYPNEEDFTRIVGVKHATGQLCANTTIVREYPDDFGPGKEPYYPIPAPDAAAQYKKYKERADKEGNVPFIGRLAIYRYYNMAQVIGMALAEVEKISRADS